jgi:sugar phosphate isomerase/epimerase
MGFVGIEIESLSNRQTLEVYTRKNIRRLRESCADIGITPAQYLPFYIGRTLADSRVEKRKEALSSFEKEVEVAKSLGTELVELPASPVPGLKMDWKTIYAGGPPSKVQIEKGFEWTRAWETYVNAIGHCCDIVQGADLALAVEPMPRYVVNNSDSALKLLNEVESGVLGVNLDTGHLFAQKEIVPVSIEKLGNKIFAAHLSDNDGKTEFHWAPGRGELDWESILIAFNKVGFEGILNIEVSGVDDLDEEFLKGKEHIEQIMCSVEMDA